MGAESSSDATLVQRLLVLVKTLQFAWFIGHLCLILCVLRYIFLCTHMKFYSDAAEICYRTAFASAATTYGIAVYKILCFRARSSQKIPALSIAAHETVQYLALALAWLFMPQWPIALLPYLIYSVFHVAVYTSSTLIPALSTNMVPIIKAKLMRKFEADVVPALQNQLVRKIENSVAPALQASLNVNLNPALKATLQTNTAPNLQAQLQAVKVRAKFTPVILATPAPGAEMVPPSDSTDTFSVFIQKHYNASMSVLSQTMISFFIPQWIYPLFHLVTRLAALPISTSSAKTNEVSMGDSTADNIRAFITTYYDISMSAVTSLEVSIWFSLLISTVALQHWSWIMIVLYTVFLRTRYDLDDFTRLEAKANGFLDAQDIYLPARPAWKIAMKLTRGFYHISDPKNYMGGDSDPKKIKNL